MGSSPRLTRRRLFTAAAAVAALRFQPVRAQPLADTSCTIGFLNGLLQFDPDCPLLSLPALGAEVAPPSHLVSLAQAGDGATGDTSGDLKPPQSGSRRKRQQAREHERRKYARQRRQRRRRQRHH